MGLLMCAEFLRLGYTFTQLNRALRAVKHPNTRITAMFLANLMRAYDRFSQVRTVRPAEIFFTFLPIWLSQLRAYVLRPGWFD